MRRVAWRQECGGWWVGGRARSRQASEGGVHEARKVKQLACTHDSTRTCTKAHVQKHALYSTLSLSHTYPLSLPLPPSLRNPRATTTTATITAARACEPLQPLTLPAANAPRPTNARMPTGVGWGGGRGVVWVGRVGPCALEGTERGVCSPRSDRVVVTRLAAFPVLVAVVRLFVFVPQLTDTGETSNGLAPGVLLGLVGHMVAPLEVVVAHAPRSVRVPPAAAHGSVESATRGQHRQHGTVALRSVGRQLPPSSSSHWSDQSQTRTSACGKADARRYHGRTITMLKLFYVAHNGIGI